MRALSVGLPVALVLLGSSVPCAGMAQEGPADEETDAWADRGPLVTDRPAFTGSPLTVHRGHVQVETGYTLTRAAGSTQHSVGEVNVRIGLVDRLEARIGLNSFAWIVAPGNNPDGLEDASLGARVHFLDAKPGTAIPDLGFTLTASIPTGSSEIGHGAGVQPIGVLAGALPVTGWLMAESNLGWGYLDDGTGRYSQFSASLELAFTLSRVVGAYAEYYGLFPGSDGGVDGHFLDGGFAFLVSRDVQIDARAGLPLNGSGADFFVGFGLAFRL